MLSLLSLLVRLAPALLLALPAAVAPSLALVALPIAAIAALVAIERHLASIYP